MLECVPIAIAKVFEQIFGSWKLLDASFPESPFLAVCGGATVFRTTEEEGNKAEESFYDRFRQNGGHQKIEALNELFCDPATVAEHEVRTLVLPETKLANNWVSLLRLQSVLRLAIYCPDIAPPFSAGSLQKLGRCTSIRWRNQSGNGRIYLYSPKSKGAPAEDGKFQILCEQGLLLPIASDFEGEVAYSVNAPLQLVDGKITMHARQFIHDGDRLSEGDTAYSWLWVGASKNVRIFLGVMPLELEEIRVIVPRSLGANLKDLKVFVDGIAVESTVEIWDEELGAGAVSARIGPARGPRVLGLAARHCMPLDASPIPLSFCIDKVEVF